MTREPAPFRGNDTLLFGIILGVVAFWLFAQTTLNIAPTMASDLEVATNVMNIAVSITALFSGIFIVVIGGLADRVGRVKILTWGFVLGIIGSVLVGPENGGRAATISYRITPSDQMSVRASTSTPRACSGDMYVTVPITRPASVRNAVWVASAPMLAVGGASLASPKSRTLATPSGRIITFSGFTSRCTTPAACAAVRAVASWTAISTASRSTGRPRASRWRTVSPSTYSIAMN